MDDGRETKLQLLNFSIRQKKHINKYYLRSIVLRSFYLFEEFKTPSIMRVWLTCLALNSFGLTLVIYPIYLI